MFVGKPFLVQNMVRTQILQVMSCTKRDRREVRCPSPPITVALLLGLSGRVARAYFGPDLRIPFVARALEIILGLHVDPIVRCRVEVASETQGGLPGNPPLAGYDSGNPVGRHVQRLGQAVHANS